MGAEIWIFTLLIAFLLYKRFQKKSEIEILLIVFGEFERSPRMMNHAKCFIANGFKVNVVTYRSEKDSFLKSNPSLCFIPLQQPKKLPGNRILYLFRGIYRAMSQLLSVFLYCYLYLDKPKLILIQNPPAIPTILLARCLSLCLNTPLIIDWHNFGFSIMAMERPKGSSLVRLAEIYEKRLGRSAFAHLTVTKAMAKELQSWGMKGKLVTLYDKAPNHINPLTLKQKISFMSRLDAVGSTMSVKKNSPLASSSYTTFDFISRTHTPKQDTPAIIVSSTSWTVDEDFSILLDALVMYDQCKRKEKVLPVLHCIITGKGPMQKYYMNQVEKLGLEHVSIFSAWLPAADYPKLLSSSSLGISLHSSSSGLDLPMKIVDMFAAGTPTLALEFNCIDELVQNGKNGFTFKNATELNMHLTRLLLNEDELQRLREGVKEFRNEDWESNWDTIFLPIILEVNDY